MKPAAPDARREQGGRPWLPAAGAALAAFLLYAPTLAYGFLNWDDNFYVFANPYLGNFDWRFVKWAFTTTYIQHWSPLLWISLGIDHALWGMNPAGYHLTNVLLHGLNTFLTVLLSFALLGFVRPGGRTNAWLAAAAGLVFAAHPLHVEAVAWISSRKDQLYSFFYLAGLLAYAGYVSSAGRRRQGLYALSLLAFAFSLMSKPMAVTLPAVLLILDLYPFRRIRGASDALRIGLLEKVPFYLGSLALSVITVRSYKGLYPDEADRVLHELTFPAAVRAWTAVRAVVLYPWKAVLPFGLAAYQPMPMGSEAARVSYPGSLAAFIVVSAAVVWLARRLPGQAAAWACYLVMVFPTLGLTRVFGVTAVADRFVYLPLLALILPAVAGAGVLLDGPARRWRAPLAALGALWVLALGGLTLRQSGYWRDPVSFWSRNVEQNPQSYESMSNLAMAHYQERSFDRAALWFSRSIAVYGYRPYAHYGLGISLHGLGRTEEGLRSLDTAVAMQAAVYRYTKTGKAGNDLAEFHRARFQLLAHLGRYEAAVADFASYAELSGKVPPAVLAEGRRLAGSGRPGESVRLFERLPPAPPTR